MVGGTGDDTFIIENTNDKVTENVNEGIDTVQSNRTYTLAANVEALILTGTTACDPALRTPWGTIIVGEEATDGNIIEIINPLATTNVLFNRVTGTTSGGVGLQMSSCDRRSDASRSKGSRSTRTA